MSIEAGARAGMIAPDQTTYDYLRGREFVPSDFDAAVTHWQELPSDAGAAYDKSLTFAAADIAPQITWGTNPGQVISVNASMDMLQTVILSSMLNAFSQSCSSSWILMRFWRA